MSQDPTTTPQPEQGERHPDDPRHRADMEPDERPEGQDDGADDTTPDLDDNPEK